LSVGGLVITQEEKELGCLMIDFGGLTTGIAIYTEGSIRFSKELQVGSDFITRDISHSLRTSLSVAQDIKEKYGIAMGSLLKADSSFDFTAVDGRTIREATRKQLVEIIQPRLDQIFVTIDEEVKKSNLSDAIVAGGVILTGGGARLEGIIQAAEQALNSSTRLGLPQDIAAGPEEIIGNTSYSTAIALLRSNASASVGYATQRPSKGMGMMRKMKDWFEQSF
jgi:cell division protein FtsA